MNVYRLSKVVEDEVQADTHYDAFLEFRSRWQSGYYGPRQEDVELLGEVILEVTEESGP